MEFIITDKKTGKQEVFGTEIFFSDKAESYPTGKRITPKAKIAFGRVLAENVSEIEILGKIYSVVVENGDKALVAIVKAWVNNEPLIKKLILTLAKQAINGSDPFLKDNIFDVQEGQLLSIRYFEMPFKVASLEISKMFPEAGSGFDENEGEFVKWIWIYTLVKAFQVKIKNGRRFANLIKEIREYYVCA